MSQLNDLDKVIQALRTVPEKKLRIIELTWKLVDKKGNVDFEKVADKQRDVNLAVAEAQAYVKQTDQAKNALRKVPGCPQ